MAEFRVNDMTCNHCAATITKAVRSLDQAAKVDIDLASKHVRVESTVDARKVEAAIRDAGFTPAGA